MNSLMCKDDTAPKPVEPGKMKPSGPSVYLNSEQTKALFGEDVPKVGENYATEMGFTVKSVTKREDGLDVQIELTECDCCEGAEDAADTEEGD